MSKNKNKEIKAPVSEAVKAEIAAVLDVVASDAIEEVGTPLHESIELLLNLLIAIEPGLREVDLAKEDAIKHLEKVSILVAFIEKALSEKK
jgi:hypothetical protein